MKTTRSYSSGESRSMKTALPSSVRGRYSRRLMGAGWGAPLRSLALLVAIAGVFEAHGQTVSLGAASFTGSSDQVRADWYWPMPSGAIHTYDGFGALVGATRTETYTPAQGIAGVKTVQWHMETKIAGSLAATVEDWWLALDVAGNLRVLKIAQSGSTGFIASNEETPPIFLPSSPAKGQTWDFLGNKLTIEGVMKSRNSQGGLKLAIAAPGSPVEYYTYMAGVGLVQDATSAKPAPIGSGWTLRSR